MDGNDQNKSFIEVDIKKELQESFIKKNAQTNGV